MTPATTHPLTVTTPLEFLFLGALLGGIACMSPPMAIEVVLSNWQDDYMHELADYEVLGIPEYWVVDYAASGATQIGEPKQPLLSA